jgi:hypothetical protein
MIPTGTGTNLQPVFLEHLHQPLLRLAVLTGADHWKIERLIAIVMLAIIPSSFAFNSVLMNYFLAASLAIHAHWGLVFSFKIFYMIVLYFLCIGMDTVLINYCPRKALPLANMIRYLLTTSAFAGLW